MNELALRHEQELKSRFLERKSGFNRRSSKPRPLPLQKVAAEIAETLVAFANADGGELIVGLDDDGTTSGLPFSEAPGAGAFQTRGSRQSEPPRYLEGRPPDSTALGQASDRRPMAGRGRAGQGTALQAHSPGK